MRVFIDLWSKVDKLILCPTYAIFEKKFYICIVCVEAFLDSGYNSKLTHDDFFWSGNRNQWANEIYSVISVETIKMVSNVIHRLSLDSFTNARLSLLKDLRETNSNLCRLIEACPIDEAYDFLATKQSAIDKNNKILSPNVQTFLAHLHSIKREIGHRSMDSVTFFMDDNGEYLESCIKHFCTINDGEIRTGPIDKDTEIIFGSNGTWSIKKCNSIEHELIQLADLCCGYLNHSMNAVSKGAEVEFKFHHIHLAFWAPFFVDIGIQWYYHGFSNDFSLRFKEMYKNILMATHRSTKYLFTNAELEKLENLYGKDRKFFLAQLKQKYRE